MPKFVQEILDNPDYDYDYDYDFDFDSKNPDFPSGSKEEFLFPDDLETL